MEKLSLYFWGFFLIIMSRMEYGSIEKTPTHLVMLICTLLICGAISGVKNEK